MKLNSDLKKNNRESGERGGRGGKRRGEERRGGERERVGLKKAK
jgi:hypothetical protein